MLARTFFQTIVNPKQNKKNTTGKPATKDNS